MLERLKPSDVGPERHDAELGLVAEHREHQHLVPVGLERRDGIEDTLRPAGLGVGSGAVQLVEEMEDAPPLRRLNGFHEPRLPPALHTPLGQKAGL